MSPTNRHRLPFTPLHWIGGAGLCALLLAALAILLATRQPWLGLELRATADDQAPPRVRSVRGPAADLPQDMLVRSLGDGRVEIELHGFDLAPEPDTRFVELTEYRRFLERQTTIASITASSTVVLVDTAGQRWAVQPSAERPLRTLPVTFWLQLFVGCAGLLTGAAVWAFRREDAAAAYVALTGVGLLLSAVAASVYSTRELALDGALFRLLHLANGAGALLFCGAFSATLWHYPTRLGPTDAGRGLLAGYGVVFVLLVAGWPPNFDLALRLPILAGFALTAVFAILQWRRSRKLALQRTALKWFLLAWLGGGGAFLAVVFLPPLFGVDSGGAQAWAFALFLVIYAGLALGVARYRLFDLDRWWFTAWTLLAGAALFVALDLAMIQFTRLGGEDALLLSLLIVTWLYLPLRHWLWRRLAPPRGGAEAALHVLAHPAAGGPVRQWPAALQGLFEPLQLHQDDSPPIDQAQLVDQGAGMRVPGIGGSPGLLLRHAQRGRHLFSPEDLQTADALHGILQRLAAERKAVADGIQQERERIARALHDDVGARLLSLLHESTGGPREHARRALEELRLVLHGLAAHQRPLEDLLGWCRGDLHECAEIHNTTLNWDAPTALPAVTLDPHHVLLMLRCLRELIAQSAGGAAPLSVVASIATDGDVLRVQAHRSAPDDTLPSIPGALLQRAEALGIALQMRGDAVNITVPLRMLD